MKGNMKKETIYVVFILLVAAYFRLHDLSYMEFKYDEADASVKALQFVQNQEFPLVGLKSSMGAFNPPIFVYLWGIPALISSNPLFLTGFIAAMNIAAVYLCYLFSKKLFGPNVALIASLFFAVNPWAVLFSRKIWAQDMLPLFVLLFLLSLWNWLEEKNIKWVIPAFLFLGVLLQLHMSSVVFIILFIAALWMYKPQFPVKSIAIGILILVILFLPYAVYEFRNDFYNAGEFVKYAKKESHFIWQSVTLPFALATTYGLEYSLGNSYGNFEGKRTNLEIFNWLALILLVVGIASVILTKGKKLLLLWLLLPSALFLFSKAGVYPHYFILTLPVQFILIAKGLMVGKEWLEKNMNKRIASYGVIFLFLLLILPQALFTYEFQEFIKNNPKIDGDYGVPYKYRIDELRNTLVNEDPKDWPKDLVNGYIINEVLLKK